VVVNTDGDNQYPGSDIPKLTAPILDGSADMVVGCRPIMTHPEFGWIKKLLQAAGSWTLRRISRTNVRDAASGFRAFSRETCQKLFVHSKFSHCMESLVQAGNSGLRVGSVDIGINPKQRHSRLFRSIPEYLYKSGATILSMFVLYRPLGFFWLMAAPFCVICISLAARYLYLAYLIPDPDPDRTYLPSLIACALSGLIGVFLLCLGVLGELFRSGRRINEEILYYLRTDRPLPVRGNDE